MKNLLGLSGAISLVVSTGATSVISCDKPKSDNAMLEFNNVDEIYFNSKNLTNKTITISPAKTDNNFMNVKLTAKSSNEEIATVRIIGDQLMITPLSSGETSITVSGKDYKDLTFKISILEFQFNPIEEQTLVYDSTKQDNQESTSILITSKYEDLASSKLTVKSSDQKVAKASFSANNLTITPVAVGETTITISLKGYIDLSFKVTVTAK